MKDIIDAKGNTVKNIGSYLNQSVTGTSLKDNSVSTHRRRSLVSFHTLKTAGLCVQ
jgi:hypothetical protein